MCGAYQILWLILKFVIQLHEMLTQVRWWIGEPALDFLILGK